MHVPTYICIYLYLSAYLVYKYMCIYEWCIWYAVYIIYVGINGLFTLYMCVYTHMYTVIFTLLCTHCVYIHSIYIYIHYTHYLLAAVYSQSHLLYYM